MNLKVDQKQETRRRILAAAATSVRRKGFNASSVGEVMAAAGLTVGGFYAHFQNKDDLMLEALEQVLAERRELLLTFAEGDDAATRRRNTSRAYLSRKHRDMDEVCCPLPAILSELPKQSAEFRLALEKHLKVLITAMASDDVDKKEATATAMADLCLMVGGLTLARALGPTHFSDAVLAAAKSAIR
jgi:TetR/AcrR family transcriptional regulator, transcriptional repressor for nem operon